MYVVLFRAYNLLSRNDDARSQFHNSTRYYRLRMMKDVMQCRCEVTVDSQIIRLGFQEIF